MYLSAKTIRESKKVLVRTKTSEWVTKPLFDPVDETRYDFIEGSAFNLTLGNILAPDPNFMANEGSAFIGIKKRSTPPTVELEPTWLEFKGYKFFGWELEAFSEVLLVSNEVCNTPIDCFEPVKSRFTFAGAFSSMICSDAHPNYQGKITTKLTVGPVPLKLEKGCHFCFVRLARFDTEYTDAYDGIYGVEGCGSTTNGKLERGI
jgi:deoxycytidine triphosphate deaminase